MEYFEKKVKFRSKYFLIIVLSMLSYFSIYAQNTGELEVGGTETVGNLRVISIDPSAGYESDALYRWTGSVWQGQFCCGDYPAGGSSYTSLQANGNNYTWSLGAPIIREKNGDSIIVVYEPEGSGLRLRHYIKLTIGSQFVTHRYTLTNISESVISNVSLMRSADTYLAGNDMAEGYWDADNQAVEAQRIDGGTLRRLVLQAVTPPNWYATGDLNTVSNWMSFGESNYLNTSFSDHAYGFHWKKESFAAGEVWEILMYEKYGDAVAGGLQVTAPLGGQIDPGNSIDLIFKVKNVTGGVLNTTFNPTIDLAGWSASVVSPTNPVSINPSEIQNVTVRVLSPANASNGQIAIATLTATNGSNSGSETSQLTVVASASMNLTADQPITEANIDSRSVDVTITGVTFSDGAIDPANVSLLNAPSGCTIESVNYTDPTHCTVNLSFDGTDFDSDFTDFKISIAGIELSSGTNLTSSSLTITASNDDESISIASDGDISEGHENGEIITVTLNGGTFAPSLTASNWTVTNLPAGVSKGTVTRVNNITATIALSGNRTTDYDDDITNMTVQCSAAEYNDASGGGALTDATGITITAINELPTVSIATDQAINESNLDSSSINVTIGDDTFIDNTLSAANFTLTNAPDGCTIESVSYSDPTNCIVNLAYDGTDFDADIANFGITVNAAELNRNTTTGSNNPLAITATNDIESISIASDGDIYENYENGEIITVTLNGGTFAPSLTASNWTVTNLPAGVSKGAVTRVNNTTATFALSGNRTTDYDDYISNMTVQCSAVEYNDASGGGSLVDSTGVLFIGGIETISMNISADQAMTEPNLDSRSITVTISGDAFIDNTLSAANFTLTNAPAGCTIEAVSYTDPTHCTVNLAFNGTDFDSDVTNLRISINAQELQGNNTLNSGNQLAITAINDVETISISSDGGISEGNENGEIITITLNGGTFAPSLTASNWTVINLPLGVSKGAVSRVNNTTATIAFSGNRTTDYDDSITNLTVQCSAAEYNDASGGGAALSDSTGVTFTAINETISMFISADQMMTEPNLDSRSITVTVSGDAFIDNTLSAANFTLTNAPAGCTIEAVSYTDPTHCTVNLAFNGTDFDSDVTNLRISINAQELQGNNTLNSGNQLAITAINDVETISISSDGGISEGNENGEIITITLNGGTFAPSLTASNWTVTNLPLGVSKGAVSRVNNTTATIALSGNRTTDYDDSITNLTVQCSAAEYNDASGGGAALSDSTGVTFTAINETISMNIASDQLITESNLDSRSITVTISGDVFIDNTLSAANFALTNAPAGCTIEAVSYTDPTHCTVNLAFNGTDFDSDVTNLRISINAQELQGNNTLNSGNQLTITATNDFETINIASDSDIREGNENGEIITITLNGGTFASSLTASNWTVTNLPLGVSKGTITRINSKSATIKLSGNRATDYDNNINVKVRCTSDEYSDAAGETILTSENGIILTAIIEVPEPPSVSSTTNPPKKNASWTPYFQWPNVIDATSYKFQLSLSSDFQSTIIDTIITDTTFTSSELSALTKYYWRVASVNTGGHSPYSSVDTFETIIAPPSSVSSKFPADNEINQPVIMSYSWNKADRATQYDFHISNKTDYTDTVEFKDSLTDTSYNSGVTLSNQTSYYWRVRAVNINSSSDWSNGAFTTIPQIVIPAPRIPEVKEGNKVSTDFTATWIRVDSASGYRIQLSKDSTFLTTFTDSVIIGSNFLKIKGLAYETQYFYRVAAIKNSTNGPWSQTAKILTVTPTDSSSVAVVAETYRGEAQLGDGVTLSSGDTEFEDGIRIEVKTLDNIEQIQGLSSISNILDFSNSQKREFDSSVLLTVPVSSVTVDGIEISDSAKKLISAYWIDSTGSLNVIYDAYHDQEGNIVVPTNVLGKFVIAVDTTKPAIKDSTATVSRQLGSAPDLSGRIIDNIVNCRTFAYFRRGGDEKFDSISVSVGSDGNFDFTIDGQQLMKEGFEYFLGAFDGINRVNLSRTNLPVLVTGMTDTNYFPAEKWHLFAIPITLNKNQISDFLKDMGVYGKDWKLFARSLSSVHDSFVEYGPNLDRFNTAVSYWLKTKKSDFKLMIDSGTATAVNRCFEIQIPAKSWASIGNPYLFPIAWQAVLDSTGNDAEQMIGPYTYEDSAWIPPTDIDKIIPWQGYYVYNSGNSPITIRIPSLRYKNNLLKRTISADSLKNHRYEWIVSNVKGKDYRNYFGIINGASDGYDRSTDFPKAGSPNQAGPKTWFTRSSFAKIADKFQTDFTEYSGGAKWFPIAGNLHKGETYNCQIQGIKRLPDSLQCMLFDLHSGKYHNIKTSAYSFTALEGETERPFELIIGTEAYITSSLKGAKLPPQKLTLAKVFPNPIRSRATIKYALPWQAGGIPVNLSIFDTQGRLIKTLVNKTQKSGYYSVDWNLMNYSNARIASGTYFLRLDTGKLNRITKLQIIR